MRGMFRYHLSPIDETAHSLSCKLHLPQDKLTSSTTSAVDVSALRWGVYHKITLSPAVQNV
jgi:hypothetical protein